MPCKLLRIRYKRLATDLFASAADVPYRLLAGLRDMLLGVVLALNKDAIPHQDLAVFNDLLVRAVVLKKKNTAKNSC